MIDAADTGDRPLKTLLMTLIHGGLSYLRWTQTVPMILGWAFAIVLMLGALFVGFQEQSFALLTKLTDSFPGLSEQIRVVLEGSGTTTEPDNNQVMEETVIPWIFRACEVSVTTIGMIAVGGAAAGADPAESVFPLLLMGFLLFAVSAYSPTVGHVIGKIQQGLE